MRSKAIILIAALLFVAAIWRAPLTPDVRYNMQNAFAWSAITLFAFYCVFYVHIWLGLFIILAAFCAYCPVNSLRAEKAFELVICGALWYTLCMKFIQTDKEINFILSAICIIGLVHLTLLISQGMFDYQPAFHMGKLSFFGGAPTKLPFNAIIDTTPDVGIVGSPNSASVLLALCLPAFWRKRWKCFVPLFVFGFYYAKTFSGPLSITVVLLFIAFVVLKGKRNKMVFCISGLSFLVLYYFFVDKPDITWRLASWKMALFNLFPEHPITGVGLNHWEWVFRRVDIAQWVLQVHASYLHKLIIGAAHNTYIQQLLEMGIGFAVIVVGYYINIFIKAGRLLRTEFDYILLIVLSALIIITVTSNVFFVFRIGLLALISLTYMAILQVKLHRNKEPEILEMRVWQS